MVNSTSPTGTTVPNRSLPPPEDVIPRKPAPPPAPASGAYGQPGGSADHVGHFPDLSGMGYRPAGTRPPGPPEVRRDFTGTRPVRTQYPVRQPVIKLPPYRPYRLFSHPSLAELVVLAIQPPNFQPAPGVVPTPGPHHDATLPDLSDLVDRDSGGTPVLQPPAAVSEVLGGFLDRDRGPTSGLPSTLGDDNQFGVVDGDRDHCLGAAILIRGCTPQRTLRVVHEFSTDVAEIQRQQLIVGGILVAPAVILYAPAMLSAAAARASEVIISGGREVVAAILNGVRSLVEVF